MKNRIQQGRLGKAKGIVLRALLLGGLAFLPLPATPTARAHNGGHGNSDGDENPDSIVGNWLVQKSLHARSIPPNVPLTLTSVETYNRERCYLESNDGPAAGGPDGQGDWARTGHLKFAVTELRLGFDSASHSTRFNNIRRSVTIERGDQITGTVLVDIALPNGPLAPFRNAGIFHGPRVPIESWD